VWWTILLKWCISAYVLLHVLENCSRVLLLTFYVFVYWISQYFCWCTHWDNTRLTALFPGLSRWASTRKAKTIWILLKQETVSGSGISWAVCKSAASSRQITMPAPHHSVFYRPDALPVAQPTASKHWRHWEWTKLVFFVAQTVMCANVYNFCEICINYVGGVLAWLFVWSDVQICIWPSWCHCHPLPLASVKSRLVLPVWYRLTWVVPDKGLLNGCVCVCVCVWTIHVVHDLHINMIILSIKQLVFVVNIASIHINDNILSQNKKRMCCIKRMINTTVTLLESPRLRLHRPV